jgi:lipoteichoic acid synthase
MRQPVSFNLFFLKGRVWVFIIIIFFKVLFLRSNIFPQNTDLQILLLELGSLVLIFGLLELTALRSLRLFWLVNYLLSTYFMASVMYYSYFGQILNFSVLRQTLILKDLGPSISDLFSLTYLIFYLDFLLLFILRNFQKATKKKRLFAHSAFPYKTIFYNHHRMVLITFLALVFTFFNIWSYPTKDNRMAMTRDVGILNTQGYGLYTIFSRSKENNTSYPESQFSQEVINKLKQVNPLPWPKYFGVASAKNIILVQLESTENFVIGLKVNNQEITPNLNALSKDSLYFPQFYSQIGQGNTSDAEFISNTSLYPLPKGAISTDYEGVNYPSLPRLLKNEGYSSVTLHPNILTFWRRDNLYPCLGFDKYYAKDYYQDQDLLGPWGSSDELLYKKALPILTDFLKSKQKFYASLITLTNHHPYSLPENRKKINLPPQLEKTTVGNYLTSVNYQDYALGQFIQDLKDNYLWDNSIFLVFGDHFGVSKIMESQHRDIFTSLLGREHDKIDGLNVPLFIRVPGLRPQIINTPGGQVDILPTLANLLGLSLDKQLVFGQDLLNYDQNLLGFRFYHPDGTFITADLFYQEGSTRVVRLTNRQVLDNGDSFREEELRIKKLLQLSDNYLQYLIPKNK